MCERYQHNNQAVTVYLTKNIYTSTSTVLQLVTIIHLQLNQWLAVKIKWCIQH